MAHPRRMTFQAQHDRGPAEQRDEAAFVRASGEHLAHLTVLSHASFRRGGSHGMYNLFSALLRCFLSPGVTAALLPEGRPVEGATDRELLECVVLPHMVEEGEVVAPAVPAVELFMSVYGRMEERHRREVLQGLKASLGVEPLRLLVERLAELRGQDKVAAEWLRSAQLGSRLVGLVEGLCGGEEEEEPSSPPAQHRRDQLTALFNFVLSNTGHDDGVVGQEHISEILTRLSLNLRVGGAGGGGEPREETVQLVARLAGQLFTACCSCHQAAGVKEFLRSLFQLVCESSSRLSPATARLLRDTFLQAHQGLAKAAGPETVTDPGGVLSSALEDMRGVLLSDSCSYRLAEILAELAGELLKLAADTGELLGGPEAILLDCDRVQALLDRLMPSEGEWADLEARLSPLYVVPAILQGATSFMEFPFPRSTSAAPPWEHGHSRTALFLSHLLLGLCGRGDTGAEERVSLGKYTHLVVCALHSTCHATTMLDLTHTTAPVSEDVLLGVARLREVMCSLLGRLNTGNKRLITKQIRDRCSEGSSAWCVTLTKVLRDWMGAEEVNAERLLEGLDQEAVGHSATRLSLLGLLPEATLQELVREEGAKLSSCSEDPLSAAPCLSLLTSALSLLPPTPAAAAAGAAVEEAVCSAFSVLTQWRENADDVFMFATELHGVAWEDVVLPCGVVRLVTVLVSRHRVLLQPQHWDFILCCLSSWVQSLQDSCTSIHQEAAAGAFAAAVCECVGCMAEFMEEVERDEGGKGHPPKLAEDWREFFSAPIYNSLISIFMAVAAAHSTVPSVMLHGVCRAVCVGVCWARREHLLQHSLPPAPPPPPSPHTSGAMTLPAPEQALVGHLGPMLVWPHPAVQCSAHLLLETALPSIMEAWEGNEVTIRDEDDTPQRPLPPHLVSVLHECGEAVREEVGGEGAKAMLPHSLTFTRVVGYLLAWRLTLAAITLASDANQHQYSAFLRNSSLLNTLLHNLFLLMPGRPVLEEGPPATATAAAEDKAPTPSLFAAPLNLSPQDVVYTRLVPHLACKVYLECLRRIPAAVRQWFGSLDRPTQAAVDSFTSAHVSPLLVQQEMATITSSSTKFSNMVVRCRPGAREVVALYTIDEAKMELVLRLAPNHPLTSVTVEDHHRVGVSLAQWRNWLLGLNTMLSHRNTPLLQSLAFWKQNVDQKFSGLEECYICYYVLHGTNHQLPKLLCRTCKKKFHSACLYKWFNSSNNSTCPLCRSLF